MSHVAREVRPDPRFNVLADMYLIRDDQEDALTCLAATTGVPLNICDRNLNTDEDGNLTGQLPSKVADPAGRTGGPYIDPTQFTGPFNLVNGPSDRTWTVGTAPGAGHIERAIPHPRPGRRERRDAVRQIGTERWPADENRSSCRPAA